MTILDVLLGQKMILISVVFALAPLCAAITLVVSSRMRRRLARRARAKRIHTARVAQMLVAQPAVAAGSDQKTQPPMPAAPAQPEPTPVYQAHTPAGSPTPQSQSPDGQQPPAEATEQAKPVSSAMQDILSSVFGDDEALAHYEMLLKDLDQVDTTELVALCHQVSDQIHADSASAAEE